MNSNLFRLIRIGLIILGIGLGGLVGIGLLRRRQHQRKMQN